MKNILIFGDSNTFGCNPKASSGKDTQEVFRYAYEASWPGILQEKLAGEYKVIAEGLPGRTAFLEEITKPFRTGRYSFTAICQSHYPVDLLIFMLGTNDIKFAHSADLVAKSMQGLLEMAKNPFNWEPQPIPDILLIAPPLICENIRDSCFYEMFTEESVAISAKLGEYYYTLAKKMGCAYLDAGKIAEVSPVDCVHLTLRGHTQLGEAVYNKVREIYK